MWRLTTPVALFAFNRPDTTRRVFDQIRAVEPPKLFVVADGPRDGHPSDENRCRDVREIVSEVDWPCEVYTTFRDRNLGLPRSVYEGLDWVFGTVSEAIILEDDTLPNEDFFRFCETLLDRYRGDDRVMSINGTNRLHRWKADSQSHHFVTWQDVWGWASWSDAWAEYDPDIPEWSDPEVRARIRDHVADDERFAYHSDLFDSLSEGGVTGWSRAWRFAMFRNGGLSAVPSRNLVSNVGFDDRGHYATDPESPLANLPRHELSFPLDRRRSVVPDRAFERTLFDRYRRTSRLERMLTAVPNELLSVIPGTMKAAVKSRYL